MLSDAFGTETAIIFSEGKKRALACQNSIPHVTAQFLGGIVNVSNWSIKWSSIEEKRCLSIWSQNARTPHKARQSDSVFRGQIEHMSETKKTDTDKDAEAMAAVTASPAETRAMMTKVAGRGYLQLRHILVQLPDDEKERGSTVGLLASGKYHRALLVYLLILTCWPWLEERTEPLAAKTWLRALEPPTAKGLTFSASTLSRAFKVLQDNDLIEKRPRVGQKVLIVPRREDGRESYSAPAGRKDRRNAYFTLPDSFWTEELFAKLKLPGLAMLLIIAKETNKKKEMHMTHAEGLPWYGLKPGMVKDGLQELRDEKLLGERDEWTKAPLSDIGRTRRKYYWLTGEYSQESRELARRAAQSERAARLKDKEPEAA